MLCFHLCRILTYSVRLQRVRKLDLFSVSSALFCVLDEWFACGGCVTVLNKSRQENNLFKIVNRRTAAKCVDSLPQTKLIWITNERKQCEHKIYGLVFGFRLWRRHHHHYHRHFVTCTVCERSRWNMQWIRSQRGAWRLSVLLLLLLGTIYVSHFSLLLVPFTISCITHATHKKPELRMCHAVNWPNAYAFELGYWLFVFQFFGRRLYAQKLCS